MSCDRVEAVVLEEKRKCCSSLGVEAKARAAELRILSFLTDPDKLAFRVQFDVSCVCLELNMLQNKSPIFTTLLVPMSGFDQDTLRDMLDHNNPERNRVTLHAVY